MSALALTGQAWRVVAEALVRDEQARAQLTEHIVASGHAAAFWETTPSVRGDEVFGQVVLDAPSLARVSPDPHTFARYFTPGPSVVRFGNLRGDAELVVPTPPSPDAAYPHLMAFLERAPESAVHALWRTVGEAVQDWWRSRGTPVWVSTSGLGVSWLHVRLDSVPKYYQHAPFRLAPGSDDG